jgi:hypothetical protein
MKKEEHSKAYHMRERLCVAEKTICHGAIFGVKWRKKVRRDRDRLVYYGNIFLVNFNRKFEDPRKAD